MAQVGVPGGISRRTELLYGSVADGVTPGARPAFEIPPRFRP